MNKDTRQRIEIAKRRIREMPIQEEREIKPRIQYKWGAKQYLSSFYVGETKEFKEDFRWDSLRSIATKLKADYDCQFLFNTKFGKRFITRVQ